MKDQYSPSNAALARALGLSKSGITTLQRAGMPTHSVEAAVAWRRAQGRPQMNTFNSGLSAPLAIDPFVFLDGVDDGWAAAYQVLCTFAARHGVDRFGPAIVCLSDAMTLEALERTEGNPAIVEDRWDAAQAEHDELESAFPPETRGT